MALFRKQLRNHILWIMYLHTNHHLVVMLVLDFVHYHVAASVMVVVEHVQCLVETRALEIAMEYVYPIVQKHVLVYVENHVLDVQIVAMAHVLAIAHHHVVEMIVPVDVVDAQAVVLKLPDTMENVDVVEYAQLNVEHHVNLKMHHLQHY